MTNQIRFGTGVVGIPYALHPHEGEERHEFVNLRENPEQIEELPEPKRWPELRSFLLAINRPDSSLFTLGCECADSEGAYPAGMTHKVTSYVHVAFTNLGLANSEDAYFVLVGRFFKYTDKRERAEPLVVEFEFEKFGFVHQNQGGICLCIWVAGFGMDASAARAKWAEGLAVLESFLVGQIEF